MRKYTDNSVLQEFIETNNVPEIKKELINSIIFLLGNREEIHKAIAEAETKTDFSFEEHQDIAYENKESMELLYSEVKYILLRENYSRERFEELIDTYHKAYSNSSEEVQEEEKHTQYFREPIKDSDIEEKINLVHIIGGAIVAVVTGYIIYKIIK